MEKTDGELAKMWSESGNRSAFRSLYERHGERIYSFAYYMSSCPDRADEITQDTFLKAARSMGAFRNGSSFATWLLAIARNVAIDIARKDAKRQRDTDREHPATEPPTTHESMENRERAEVVRAAIAELKEDRRLAVTLCNLQEIPLKEAAKILGWKIEKLKSVLFRARQELKEKLSAYMDE